MATSKLLALALVLVSVSAWSREAAPPACQTAAAQPAIANAKAALERNPNDLQAGFTLADAWSDAGCFNDAVQVLQGAQAAHPGNKELETRLRVAKSLVGEEHFFDNLDRADAEAKLKRTTFRCSTLSDLEACTEALRMKPDDPALLIAQGDALAHAKRPADALNRYRLAAVLSPNQRDVAAKINAAEAQVSSAQPAAQASTQPAAQFPRQPNAAVSGAGSETPPRAAAPTRKPAPPLQMAQAGVRETPERRYSNSAPETRSH